MSNLPLPQLYSQTLSSLLPIFDDTLPLADPSTQSKLNGGLDQLHVIARMITSLGVFSENEAIEEVGDGELRFMSLGWIVGEAEGKGGLGGREDRVSALKRSETAFNSYLNLLTSYGVLTPEEQAESSAMAQGSRGPKDPAARREAKIRQYRREKDLKAQIAAGLPQLADSTSSNPVEFLIALLPSPDNRPSVTVTTSATSSTSVNPNDNSEKRSTALLLLRLFHTLALASLSSITMELDLLASAPPPSASLSELDPSDERQEARSAAAQDDTWRLDRTLPSRVQPRELISGGGRVLRPFTILPSTQAMSDRERLKGDVFKQSWRLPTMTIDEYLEEEQRRGGIISGGGQASYDAPTTSELLELAAENDGTVEGASKGEEKRLKEENWARYTEDNKRGAGNTMNRG